jgi:hypothetical protein
MATWLREPLLHFGILGAVIFALYSVLKPVGAGEKVIVVEPGIERELIEKFRQSTQRPPNAEELDNLIEGWVHSEVLYREGLALGLDKGDGAIRERVILNMKANARMQAVVDAPPEAELRAWFEAHRAEYDQPERYDIQEIQLRDRSEAGGGEAERLRDAFAGGADALLLGHVPTPYPRQTPDQLRAAFGDDALSRLQALSPGEWTVVRTRRGWHVIGLDAAYPAQQADFAALRDAIEEDWRRDQQLRLAANMIRGMRANYEVRRPGGG